jgi:thiamine biosynthesis lipoprotein
MGVKTRLVVYADSEARVQAACRAAYDRVAELEQVMSDYRPDSELMRLCAQAGGPPVKVSDDLFYVLERALVLSERSNGAFDVTVGPLVQLWRTARKTGQMPPPDQLAVARAKVGWQNVVLDPSTRTVQLKQPGMRLDLGGIGKGYAGDEALKVLAAHGIRTALFEAGGDIVVGAPPPGTDGWAIEVYEGERHPPRKMKLANAAVSTSGHTEQFVEINGTRYSHVVDPRTGLGLTNQYMATVVAPNGISTDGLSTAVTVLGAEKGEALVKTYEGARVYVRKVL